MQHEITFSCGHKGLVKVRKIDSLKSKLNQKEKLLCPDCYNKLVVQEGITVAFKKSMIYDEWYSVVFGHTYHVKEYLKQLGYKYVQEDIWSRHISFESTKEKIIEKAQNDFLLGGEKINVKFLEDNEISDNEKAAMLYFLNPEQYSPQIEWNKVPKDTKIKVWEFGKDRNPVIRLFSEYDKNGIRYTFSEHGNEYLISKDFCELLCVDDIKKYRM